MTAIERLRRFIKDELVVSWYVRRRLLAMLRAIAREAER